MRSSALRSPCLALALALLAVGAWGQPSSGDVQFAPLRAARGAYALDCQGAVRAIRRTPGGAWVDALPLVELRGQDPLEARSFRLRVTGGVRLPFRVGEVIAVRARGQYGVERSTVNVTIRDASGALLLALSEGNDPAGWSASRGREVSFRAQRGGEHTYAVALTHAGRTLETAPGRWSRMGASDGPWRITGAELAYDRPRLSSPMGRRYAVVRVRP